MCSKSLTRWHNNNIFFERTVCFIEMAEKYTTTPLSKQKEREKLTHSVRLGYQRGLPLTSRLELDLNTAKPLYTMTTKIT
jgi:hypothetical protein